MPGKQNKPVQFVACLVVAITMGGANADDSAARAGFDELIREQMTAHRLPSLSVAVAKSGTVSHADAHGFADIENSVPASTRTVYRIGSVSKTFTAVLALQLSEEGRLDLESSVRQYCPAYPEKSDLVTSRQLLGHLGGIRHYDYSRFQEDFMNTKSYESTEQALAKFASDPLAAKPGTKYLYSSWGFVLLGCVLEGAGGMSYAELAAERLLEPAGMSQTRLDDPHAMIPFRATGYSSEDDGSWSNAAYFDASDRYAAGGFLSTPSDLVNFGLALLEHNLLDDRSLAGMWAPQVTSSGEKTQAGLGWVLLQDGSEVAQGGTSVGGTAFLYLRPEEKTVVAFASNLSLWTDGRLEFARALADRAATGDSQ